MNKIDTQKNDENNQEHYNSEIKNVSENNFIIANTRNNISKTIKDDILYFKNDILKDMKEQITRLNSKYIKRINELEEKLNDTQKKSEVCYQKISNITEGVSYQKMYQQRFSELEKFQSKASESLINNEFKIKNLENLLQDTISKYDKIILDSILYPGIIGKKNEFQTFHDLLDYLLINMKKLLISKDKENLEKKETKNKIDETLEKFRGHINFCVNKVEDINQEIINYDIPKFIKNIEELKDNHKESKKNENTIFKKIEDNEKMLDNINQTLTNNIKEKTQNLYIALTNEILDINNNMQMIQDKYNEYINDFESLKKDVNNNKIILYDIINNLLGNNKGDNQMFNLYLNNKDHNMCNFDKRNKSTLDFGKIKYNSESIVKQYINGILKLSDLNKSHSNSSNKDNNVKNILSDVEMDLTKNKKKYLNLNIKNKNNLDFDYLDYDEMNHVNNKDFNNSKLKYKRKSYKINKMDENKLFHFSKAPKIKQYNNLNILNGHDENHKHKIIESHSFINPINENDIINFNDEINNVIHSKEFSKDIINSKDEELEYNNKIYLKKSKEEEKKNEGRLFQHKSEEFKNSKDVNNKQMNILPVEKNINSMTARQKLLTTKGRNINEINLNEKKEIFHLKSKGTSNSSFFKINKSKRLYSSKVMRENMIYRHMDINFDDERLIQNRENKKLTKSINQIKDILPYKDRDYFQERVQKLVQFSDKKPQKRNRSTFNN